MYWHHWSRMIIIESYQRMYICIIKFWVMCMQIAVCTLYNCHRCASDLHWNMAKVLSGENDSMIIEKSRISRGGYAIYIHVFIFRVRSYLVKCWLSLNWYFAITGSYTGVKPFQISIDVDIYSATIGSYRECRIKLFKACDNFLDC